MTDEQAFQQVADHFRETALLEATSALLEWDERTGLPANAGAYRAEQITLLSGIIHRRKTDPHIGELLELGFAHTIDFAEIPPRQWAP